MESTDTAATHSGARPIRLWLVTLLFVLGAGAAYHNALQAPFVLDDSASIADNPSLRSLWPLSGPLSPPPGGVPVSGRPLPNLTLAINHAISGDAVWSYHVLNVVLHLLSGLVLFALLRRTLVRPVMPGRVRAEAPLLALAVAALWLLHPLQTAAVTYLSQRTELLVSLCYLATLYAVARSAEGGGRRWGVAALGACLAGMASKEVMVSAPLVALLYDRTFFAGSFAGAWRARWRLYCALLATWGLLGWLVLGTAGRGGTAGFGFGVTSLQYLATQAVAVPRYLGLVFWPCSLVFDYGMYLARGAAVVAPGALLLCGLGAATVVALVKRPVLGFAGAMFFALLAPTSSVVPVATQTMAEHRMYLALAVVLALVATVLWNRWGRRAGAVLAVATLAAGVMTAVRNADYTSEERLWRDTVRKWPGNARAHNNLASVLLDRGEAAAGLAELNEALRLDPRYVDALRNLSRLNLESGRAEQAVAQAEAAQRINPDSAVGWGVVAVAQMGAGRNAGAKNAWLEALRRKPEWPEAHLGLGDVLVRLGESEAAVGQYQEALRLKPAFSAAHLALARVLGQLGRKDAALEHAEIATRLAPDSDEALLNAANLLFELDRADEAIGRYEALLRRRPDHPGVHFLYGNALLERGRVAEALAQFDEAARRDGWSAPVACSRALALFGLERPDEAVAAVDQALKLDPDYGPARELRRQIEEAQR